MAGRKLLLGIDEAGRGPLIGPMIVAGVAVDEAGLERLREIGVADSKKLPPKRRRDLFDEILSVSRHLIIVEVPPETIDSVNLNRLEEDTFAFIVSRILEAARGRGDRLVAVYADAVGPPERLARVLRAAAPGVRVTVEPRADARYRVVSAASIVAKVLRDERIEQLRRMHGVRGSGYPTDPETIEWVKEAYRANPDEPPGFIRRTWSTLQRIAPRWYARKELGATSQRQKSILDYLSHGGQA